MKNRIERDSFGTIEVPETHFWGAQTQRSLQYFHISNERMPNQIVLALALAKLCCAKVNDELGLLEHHKAEAIIRAAQEVMDDLHTEEFPLSVWQTGSGTQSNMNMNEVLANRASELLGGERGINRLIHPNDDVNLGQSSNDIFPTAMHLAAVIGITQQLLPSLRQLMMRFEEKSKAFSEFIKIGRTHLQDAIPLSLGQEFSGYVAQLKHAELAISTTLAALYELAIGATAIGTGLNTHPEFGQRVAIELAQKNTLPFISASNKFAALAAHDAFVSAHGALKTLAVALTKIANDIRWMASGPRSGLGEISIPNNEPGSSMMPGKVNPTQCEALIMLCYQVIGNDVVIALAGASGNFELNVCKPLIAYNFLQSLRLLTDGMKSFDEYCVSGIEANPERLAELMEQSLMLVTALVPHLGYDRATEIAKFAHKNSCTLKQAGMSLRIVTFEDYDKWVIPSKMK